MGIHLILLDYLFVFANDVPANHLIVLISCLFTLLKSKQVLSRVSDNVFISITMKIITGKLAYQISHSTQYSN